MTLQDYLVPFIVSQVVAVALIFVCYMWPKVGRFVWVFFFAAAGAFNLYTALTDASAYVMYGETAVFSFYKSFIYGAFSRYTTLFVSLIASGQVTVALLLLVGNPVHRLGMAGGIVFLLAISPPQQIFSASWRSS